MKLGAIITGDIIHSTMLKGIDRSSMLDVLQSLKERLLPISDIEVEIFRGDSFQVGIADPCKSLRIAMVIRSFLRSQKLEYSKKILDARVAIGIGTLEYTTDALSTSDGEAFRLSGRLLDNMGKNRLEIMTPWPEVNDEMKLATAFADQIISSWTRRQSNIMCSRLLVSENHVELANLLGITRQSVDKTLKASKEYLIVAYENRFKSLVTKHLHIQ